MKYTVVLTGEGRAESLIGTLFSPVVPQSGSYIRLQGAAYAVQYLLLECVEDDGFDLSHQGSDFEVSEASIFVTKV